MRGGDRAGGKFGQWLGGQWRCLAKAALRDVQQRVVLFQDAQQLPHGESARGGRWRTAQTVSAVIDAQRLARDGAIVGQIGQLHIATRRAHGVDDVLRDIALLQRCRTIARDALQYLGQSGIAQQAAGMITPGKIQRERTGAGGQQRIARDQGA